MEYTHWKKLTNPNYLGAYSFVPNEKKVATIKSVAQETVTGADGKKEMCLVAHFKEDLKPLVLCRTNCKAIEKVASTPNINAWVGVSISMHVEKVKAFGEIVEAVRVDKTAPKVTFTAIPKCSECGENILAYGGKTAQAIAEYTQGKYGKPYCAKCAATIANKVKENHFDALEGEKNEESENAETANNGESDVADTVKDVEKENITDENNEN